MDEPHTPAEPEPAAGPEPPAPAARRLERDLNGLVATVDQHGAELDALNRTMLLWAFAFGALAGIVFLQGRQVKELADALG